MVRASRARVSAESVVGTMLLGGGRPFRCGRWTGCDCSSVRAASRMISRGELYRGDRSVSDFCLASFSRLDTEVKFETIQASSDMGGGLKEEDGIRASSTPCSGCVRRPAAIRAARNAATPRTRRPLLRVSERGALSLCLSRLPSQQHRAANFEPTTWPQRPPQPIFRRTVYEYMKREVLQ